MSAINVFNVVSVSQASLPIGPVLDRKDPQMQKDVDGVNWTLSATTEDNVFILHEVCRFLNLLCHLFADGLCL